MGIPEATTSQPSDSFVDDDIEFVGAWYTPVELPTSDSALFRSPPIDDSASNVPEDAPSTLPGMWCTPIEVPSNVSFAPPAVERENFPEGCIECDSEWQSEWAWGRDSLAPTWPSLDKLLSKAMLHFLDANVAPDVEDEFELSWESEPFTIEFQGRIFMMRQIPSLMAIIPRPMFSG